MTTCKKPHQKINFLADAILFWKSNFACNYSRHPNFKHKYLKIMFNDLWIDNHLLIFSITLSEWSVGLSEKKLCSDFDYFDVSRFYGLFLSAKLLKNMKNGHFWEFFGHKNIKKQNNRNPYITFDGLHLRNIQTKFQANTLLGFQFIGAEIWNFTHWKKRVLSFFEPYFLNFFQNCY